MTTEAKAGIRPLVALILTALSAVASAQADRMRCHFIDVGQGSATLLEFKCGVVLVDTGTSAFGNRASLKQYLDRFFELRPDLNRTIDTVFLTHCHLDHAYGLEEVAKNFRVKNYVDNGVRKGSGKPFTDKLLAFIRDGGTTKVREVFDRQAREVPGKKGVSDDQIDPLRCDDCDPNLRLLAGGYDDFDRPDGLSAAELRNMNNHSLVLRASLGQASILITGDLETAGIKRLTEHYKSGRQLNVALLVAGHHGSRNGVTPDLVRLATPKAAVISCGIWDDGKADGIRFSTWNFGHPTKAAVDTLVAGITRTRRPKTVKVGQRAKQFIDQRITKAVYCTGWDGSIVIDTFSDGKIDVRPHGILPNNAGG